jgi:hypothetical protein
MENKANGFLPDGYQYSSSTGSEFLKLEQGDNRVRVLSTPLIGRLWWMSPEGVIRDKGTIQKGDKPVRIEYKDELPKDIHELQTKEFWMMKVWDYKNKDIRILEISQQTILKPLAEFIENSDWGDPRDYDINFKKEGSGKETKYFVMPSPQKSISEDIQKKSDESNIDLRSFLTTTEEDPFEGMDTQEASPSKEHETVDIEDKDLPF